MAHFKTPTLIVDKEIAISNIIKMKSLCDFHQMEFRPHFKTHQSAEIAQWFAQQNIFKCTVSSVGMAKYFAQNGWEDITIAIPFNIHETDELNSISEEVRINVCVDHIDTIKALKRCKRELGVFVEIDGGYGRSGVHFKNHQQIESILDEIGEKMNLNFLGFLSHTGNNYQVDNPEKGRELFETNRKNLSDLKNKYRDKFPHIILSMGDTPSSAFAKDFTGVDEWRPGNFIFYDLMQWALKSCKPEEIALSLFCPVIGIYPDRSEIVVYGGGVHLSKESIQFNVEKVYGWYFPDIKNTQFGFPVISLSQEHGIIRMDRKMMDSIRIGDFIEIIPVHSCMTADLNAAYFTKEGELISKFRTF